ncbi:hypothetical protein AB0K24_52480, partial [Streptomyces mirabilis]|uniref:hypothetical protein n=1 Tax=Streptomyces mirabilis TaxID=68239 RepID=UPI0034477F03
MADTTPRTVLERFPAGSPRGSWPADEFAAQQREQGQDTRVVMDVRTDQFLAVRRQPRPLTWHT